jgi:hypothetical protein
MEGLGMVNACIFFDHLEYFMAIWYILLPFGIFYDLLVYFMTSWYILWPFETLLVCFWYVVPKNLATMYGKEIRTSMTSTCSFSLATCFGRSAEYCILAYFEKQSKVSGLIQ